MQLVTNLIITFYISITSEGSQVTSGFEANCSSTAETRTWTQSHIMNHWKSDMSLKLPKGVWKLYIFLLNVFHFCVVLHLVFLCRSRRVRVLLKKTRNKRFHGVLTPKLEMRNYKCCWKTFFFFCFIFSLVLQNLRPKSDLTLARHKKIHWSQRNYNCVKLVQ